MQGLLMILARGWAFCVAGGRSPLGLPGWVAMGWLLMASACARKGASYGPPPPPMEARAYAGDDMALEAPPVAFAAAPPADFGASAPRGKRAEAAGAPVAAAADRKVHYSGFARLKVGSVQEATDQLSALASEWGGSVESVSGRVVTLRVPVSDFEAAFGRVVELGELLDRNISARDVTEAFTAVDLRLATARRTRDRLVELLARTTDSSEKVALIEQIQRVTEEIDRLESQLRTLSSLASFSRITVELVPRQARAWRDQDDETVEMSWIRELSPFQPDLLLGAKSLSLPTPEGMVQLTPKRHFVAEGPRGSRIWSGRLPNEPVGDGTFWAESIETRLGAELDVGAVETVGGFTLLKLTDRGAHPYSWWIAVRPDGRWLDVVEVYFPTPEALERFEEAVRTSLKAAGGAA